MEIGGAGRILLNYYGWFRNDSMADVFAGNVTASIGDRVNSSSSSTSEKPPYYLGSKHIFAVSSELIFLIITKLFIQIPVCQASTASTASHVQRALTKTISQTTNARIAQTCLKGLGLIQSLDGTVLAISVPMSART